MSGKCTVSCVRDYIPDQMTHFIKLHDTITDTLFQLLQLSLFG